MKFWKIISLWTFSVLMLGGCESKTPAQERAAHLAAEDKDVVLAVAWPVKSAKGTLLDGVKMAVEEINQQKALLNGRKVRLLIKDDDSSLVKGRLVAQEIANDLDVSAVLGHLNTFVAFPASQIYERAGIVMLTPGASGQKITEAKNQFVFRGLPGNREQGRQMAEHANFQGYKNIAIYYIKNDYGIDLANYFEQRANEMGIHVVDRRSYEKKGDNHAVIFSDWASFVKFDAIFLAGSLPEGAQIIREIRSAGINTPIFAGVGLDSPELIRLGGKDIEKTVVFTLFNPHSKKAIVVKFNEDFKKRYGHMPDSHAAQGYDSAHLLFHAMNIAKSTDPAKIAQALRGVKNWQGVTGEHSFNESGDLVGKRLVQSMVSGGSFIFDEEILRSMLIP